MGSTPAILKKIVFGSLFFIVGCASQPDHPQNAPVPITPSVEITEQVAARVRANAALEQESLEAFYSDIESCDLGAFQLRDLMVGTLRISNSSLQTIAASLAAMGYNVIDLQQSAIGNTEYSCDDLPVVTMLSQPGDLKVAFGDTIGSVQDSNQMPEVQGLDESFSSLAASPNASELDRFLVYYHPDQAIEFDKLKWVVANRLDEPSTQVYIETMVLEVRHEESSEFGVEYTENFSDRTLGLGSFDSGQPSLSYLRETFRDASTGLSIFNPNPGYRAELRALIEEGSAEVLSRPSILAVSNRQAVIQIVDIIQTPIVSSTLTEFGGLQVSSFSFEPLPIGITLNLKPRVSADRQWLTLEIDATVDAEDDENSGSVFTDSENGPVLLGEKQGSNSKKVKTFARVPDRTPIIIGGLVSRNSEQVERKMPLLGDIPYLGGLFTSIDDEYQKREIIIVLTPYILAEEAIGVHAQQPGTGVNERIDESLLFDN